MRTFQIIAAVILALIIFAVLKVMGFILKIAAGVALVGFIAGLVLARFLARR
jgi:hypothetical protein